MAATPRPRMRGGFPSTRRNGTWELLSKSLDGYSCVHGVARANNDAPGDAARLSPMGGPDPAFRNYIRCPTPTIEYIDPSTMSTVQHIDADSRPKYPNILCGWPSSVLWGCQSPILALTSIILIGNGSAHATKVPGLIFLSGQVPVDKSGKIVDGGIQEHTVRL